MDRIRDEWRRHGDTDRYRDQPTGKPDHYRRPPLLPLGTWKLVLNTLEIVGLAGAAALAASGTPTAAIDAAATPVTAIATRARLLRGPRVHGVPSKRQESAAEPPRHP